MADLTTVDWQHSVLQTLAVSSCEAAIEFEWSIVALTILSWVERDSQADYSYSNVSQVVLCYG